MGPTESPGVDDSSMTKRPEWPRVKCSPERDPRVLPRPRYGFTSRREGRLAHLLRAHGPAMGNTVSNPDWLGFTCGSSVRPHAPAAGAQYHLARVLALRSCTFSAGRKRPRRGYVKLPDWESHLRRGCPALGYSEGRRRHEHRL